MRWPRFIVGAGFIEAGTTSAHVRRIFLTHGLPNDFYTDGLSLFCHESRTTGLTPLQAVETSISEGSACWHPTPPPELLDLHLATHNTRVVQKSGEISFLSRRWEITPGETKLVTIVQQPGSFRVIAHPPTPQAPQWPDILAEYLL